MNNQIEIHEVFTRDGIQNLSKLVDTNQKKYYLSKMLEAGIKHIECASFVNPKKVSQMQDAKEIVEFLAQIGWGGLDVYALVPNYRGACDAYNAGLRKVVFVVSLSETHNKNNVNRTHLESFIELKKIKHDFKDMEIVLDVATVFGDNDEGKFKDPGKLIDFIDEYINIGISTINLCDTCGIADPRQVKLFITSLKQKYKELDLIVHFHDSRGLAMTNTLVAISLGITKIQSSIGGLGGCQFAKGSMGNLATEDLVWALNEMGYDTGIDYFKILSLAKEVHKTLDGLYTGHGILL